MVRKITSLFLATSMVAVMAVISFASGTVSEIKSGVFVDNISHTSGNSFETGKEINQIKDSFSPDETINIFLDPSKFVGEGISFNPKDGMKASDLETAGVKVSLVGGSNANLVKNVTFKEKEIGGVPVALIQVKFASDTSRNTKDFDTKIVLSANGKEQQELLLSGSVGSRTVTIAGNTDYVFLGNGEIGKASENIDNIEVDAGNDIRLYASMSKDGSYYAVSKEENDDFLSKMPADSKAYYLQTEGFTSDTKVEIKSGNTMYVYDSTGKKLGTTGDRLPLMDKYYLSQTDVSIAADDDNIGPEKEPQDTNDIEPMPGDDNPIPNTGIPTKTFLMAAIFLLGVFTLIILAVTGLKKH